MSANGQIAFLRSPLLINALKERCGQLTDEEMEILSLLLSRLLRDLAHRGIDIDGNPVCEFSVRRIVNDLYNTKRGKFRRLEKERWNRDKRCASLSGTLLTMGLEEGYNNLSKKRKRVMATWFFAIARLIRLQAFPPAQAA